VSDEAALLAAIRAHPDEDTPRLAYADWLDEQGGASNSARAEYIRLQIELARIDDDNRSPEVDARRKELYARHRSTEKKHEKYRKAWEAELTGATGPLRGCCVHWLRGFPHKALFAPAERLIAEGDALFRLAPITHLDVKDITPENLDPLLACPWLTNVRELTLNGPYGAAPRPDWEALADCPHLKNLTYLWVSRGQLSGRGGARIAAANPFPRLRKFMMSEGELGGAFTGLFGGPAFGQLEEMYVFKCGIGTADVETIAHAPATAGLTKLSLPCQPLSAAAMTALVAGRYWPNLRELVLWNCALGADGAEALGAAGPTRLWFLDLHWNDLGPRAAAALANGRILETVEELSLKRNPLGDHGTQALVRCPHLGNLRRLNLSECQLGPAGAKALAGCAGLGGLTRLTLTKNPILAEGALALADSPHLNKLEYLEIKNLRANVKARLKERFGDALRS
jgi:uncharacterized protein (TIGR02996 family)